jgi:hypothetical protein
MTTADIVRERALSLARTQVETDEALLELESCSGGRRVAAVRARQQVLEWLDSEPDQPAATRAVELLDELLARLPA